MTLKFKYIIILIFLSNLLVAQNISNVFSLRNYNQTETISIKEDYSGFNVLSSFGSIKQSSGSDFTSYKFQGQEHDSDLNVYFFPSRIYSSSEARFFAPDPKSQYHSPYLFVGADPVNNIDFDGNQGKPLVLFSQDRMAGTQVDPSTADFIFGTREDAYHVPISKFLNGQVGDIPEWNGNVFMLTHTAEDGENILVDRASSLNEMDLNTARVNYAKGKLGTGSDYYMSRTNTEEFGRSLRNFSESRGVPIKNITVGGCQGSETARRIGLGYTEGQSATNGRMLSTRGLRKGKYALTAGERVTSNNGAWEGIKGLRFYVNPNKRKLSFNSKSIKSAFRGIKEKFKSFTTETLGGVPYEMPYTEGDGVLRLINGRVPSSIGYEFETFHYLY